MPKRISLITTLSLFLVLASYPCFLFDAEAETSPAIPESKGALESTSPSLDLTKDLAAVHELIEKAKEAGVGVKTYQVMYEQAEASIKAGEPAAQTKMILDAVSRALTAQASDITKIRSQPKVNVIGPNVVMPKVDKFGVIVSTKEKSKGIKKKSLPESAYGPYMTELRSRIKSNWHPPKSATTTKAVAYFQIFEDGHMANVKFVSHSGSEVFDVSCFMALQNASPFQRLPQDSESPVDVEFSFDYNVFNGGR